MPKRKVKHTKRNPQPTPPTEKPKKSPVKAKPKKVQEKKSGVGQAMVHLAESKQGRFVPYYILAAVIIFIGVFVYLSFLMPASADLGTEYDPDLQLSEPAQDEEVAVMHTNMGDIAMRFFEEQAPKAVENFKTLAKDNYYDGIAFHRVINDFMIQGGDPSGTGSGGESAFGEDFEDEFSPSLLNIRGAVAMANSGANTNSSQFFINQNQSAQEEALEVDTLPDEVKQAYEQNGGNPLLDGYYSMGDDDTSGHTVFAQVIGGMYVVDNIAAVETGDQDKPVEDVIIESISFMTYAEYLEVVREEQAAASEALSNSSDAAEADSNVDTDSANGDASSDVTTSNTADTGGGDSGEGASSDDAETDSSDTDTSADSDGTE